MTIPWTTALQVVRKILPMVIDKAPALLKTIERLRTAPSVTEPPAADPTVSALQEQIEAHQRTITMHADTIVELRRTVISTRRSLTIARALLATTIFLFFGIFVYLLLRT